MSTSYATILGGFPRPGSIDFYEQMIKLAGAWSKRCPIERATTYYFSTSGDDATGDGSEANPWQSIAKANEVSAANVALKFKRGDVWRFVSTTLTVKGSISPYSSASAAPPRFTGRTLEIASGGSAWTVATGDRYTATLSGASRLFLKDDFFNLYKRATSTAEVEANANSYFISGSTISVNAGSGVDPNTLNWELTPTDQDAAMTAIVLDTDGGRCDGMWVDSHGLDGSVDQTWCIAAQVTGESVAWMSNNFCFYNPRHNLGSLLSSGTGGRTLYTGNVYGGVEENNGQVNVNYALNGLQEALWIDNECVIGRMPMTVTQSGTNCNSVFAHTGGSGDVGMFVVVGHKVSQPYAYGCGSIGYANNAPGDDADLATLRCVINGRLESANGVAEQLFQLKCVHLDCVLEEKPNNGTQIAVGNPSGWVINSSVRTDLTLVTQIHGRWNPASTQLSQKAINNHFQILNSDSARKTFGDRDSIFSGTSPSSAYNINNIFSVVDRAAQVYMGFANNDTTKCQRVAVWNVSNETAQEGTSYDHITDLVVLTSLPSWNAALPPSLIGRGVVIEGITPDTVDGSINIGPSNYGIRQFLVSGAGNGNVLQRLIRRPLRSVFR